MAWYPFGGPFELRPANVMSSGPLTIQTDGRTSTREIVTLAADVDHGNSGGPVLTDDGAVAGVVQVADGRRAAHRLDVAGRPATPWCAEPRRERRFGVVRRALSLPKGDRLDELSARGSLRRESLEADDRPQETGSATPPRTYSAANPSELA